MRGLERSQIHTKLRDQTARIIRFTPAEAAVEALTNYALPVFFAQKNHEQYSNQS